MKCCLRQGGSEGAHGLCARFVLLISPAVVHHCGWRQGFENYGDLSDVVVSLGKKLLEEEEGV